MDGDSFLHTAHTECVVCEVVVLVSSKRVDKQPDPHPPTCALLTMRCPAGTCTQRPRFSTSCNTQFGGTGRKAADLGSTSSLNLEVVVCIGRPMHTTHSLIDNVRYLGTGVCVAERQRVVKASSSLTMTHTRTHTHTWASSGSMPLRRLKKAASCASSSVVNLQGKQHSTVRFLVCDAPSASGHLSGILLE